MKLTTLDEIFVRVIRIVGLCGTIWEAYYEHVDRPYLLFLFASMMGLAKWESITSLINPPSGGMNISLFPERKSPELPPPSRNVEP